MAKSAKNKRNDPAFLPQRDETWHLTVRKLSIRVELEGEARIQPYLTFCVNLENETILAVSLNVEMPEADEVRDVLWQAMLDPVPELRQRAHRPTQVICDLDWLSQALAEPLKAAGVTIQHQAGEALLDDLVSLLEDELGEPEDLPGLITLEGVDLGLVRDLFEIAATAWRLAPWIYLDSEDPLKFTIPELSRSGYTQLLGNSGIEYGLVFFKEWEDFEQLVYSTHEEQPNLPTSGLVSLNYSTADFLPPEDLQMIGEYNLPVAEPEAYPLAVVIYEDRIERPTRSDLLAMCAVLSAVPDFANQLQPDLKGAYLPLSNETEVVVGQERMLVRLEYPAGVLRPESLPAHTADFSEPDEDEEVLFDIRDTEISPAESQIEGMIPLNEWGTEEYDSIQDWQKSPLAESNPSLVQAMGLVYQAWDQPDLETGLQLVRQALEISPVCAEAYIFLADELAVNLGQRYKYYQKAVDAARESLDKTYFENPEGGFWQLVECRPYLRAQAGLLKTSWEMRRLEQALEIAYENFPLDKTDALAIRYAILILSLEMSKFSEAYTFASGIDDQTTCWLYSLALLAFIETGDSEKAKESLQAALQANRFVPDYLSGHYRLPVNLPAAGEPGGKNEAVDYAGTFLTFWRQAPGAIDWLRMNTRAPKKSTSRPKSLKIRRL